MRLVADLAAFALAGLVLAGAVVASVPPGMVFRLAWLAWRTFH